MFKIIRSKSETSKNSFWFDSKRKVDLLKLKSEEKIFRNNKTVEQLDRVLVRFYGSVSVSLVTASLSC